MSKLRGSSPGGRIQLTRQLARYRDARLGTPTEYRFAKTPLIKSQDIADQLPGHPVRCYFLKDRHIISMELLKATDDAERVEEARKLFETTGKSKGADAFEVWDRKRFIYRYPEAT